MVSLREHIIWLTVAPVAPENNPVWRVSPSPTPCPPFRQSRVGDSEDSMFGPFTDRRLIQPSLLVCVLTQMSGTLKMSSLRSHSGSLYVNTWPSRAPSLYVKGLISSPFWCHSPGESPPTPVSKNCAKSFCLKLPVQLHLTKAALVFLNCPSWDTGHFSSGWHSESFTRSSQPSFGVYAKQENWTDLLLEPKWLLTGLLTRLPELLTISSYGSLLLPRLSPAVASVYLCDIKYLSLHSPLQFFKSPFKAGFYHMRVCVRVCRGAPRCV